MAVGFFRRMIIRTPVSAHSFTYPPPKVTFASAPPAAPWIKPSDLWELINKVCRARRSLCCTCNYTVLNWKAVEVRLGKQKVCLLRQEGGLQRSSRGENGFSWRRRRGGSLLVSAATAKWDPSLLPAWCHSTSVGASRKGVQNDSVFQTGTICGCGQMESLFLSSKHSQTGSPTRLSAQKHKKTQKHDTCKCPHTTLPHT